ncbi:MAG: DUF6458 family protein [Ornithinimicrobium sp.]
MGLGLGILLIVAGAILSFAVTATVEGVDLDTIGVILMSAGGLTLILGLIMGAQRTHTSHEVTQRQAPNRRRPPYDE